VKSLARKKSKEWKPIRCPNCGGKLYPENMLTFEDSFYCPKKGEVRDATFYYCKCQYCNWVGVISGEVSSQAEEYFEKMKKMMTPT